MEVGDRVAVQTLRQRGAGPERLHEGFAALPLQGLRAQLHRHATSRDAFADQAHRCAALCVGSVDEPHGQSTWGLNTECDELAGPRRQRAKLTSLSLKVAGGSATWTRCVPI